MQPPIQSRNCGEAVASLVCGLCVFLLGPLAGIPAVITGHIARRKIRESDDTLAGSGFAMAGIVLGYASIIITTLAVSIHLVILVVGAGWVNQILQKPEKKVDFLPPNPIEQGR